jgi:catechol 2,3-dioxygenase-like lactoylglutathione lyase family enzyme
MEQPPLALDRIGQIAIGVHDVERAVAFYREQLGMRFLFEAGSLAFFDCGGVRLMLSTPETAEQEHPASVLYYQVVDIHDAYAQLRGRGVRFEDEPHLIANMDTYDLWMAFFRDSEGNMLAIMGEVPRS